MHGDFTTLILRKRRVEAGEIREDQENAFTKKFWKMHQANKILNPMDPNGPIDDNGEDIHDG